MGSGLAIYTNGGQERTGVLGEAKTSRRVKGREKGGKGGKKKGFSILSEEVKAPFSSKKKMGGEGEGRYLLL